MSKSASDLSPDDEKTLWQSETDVSDAVGRLMEFWGFKRNMGRVWTVLYLSDTPLTAKDLKEKLHLSSGSVSMTVTELARWGVVRKIWIQGSRRDHYAGEGNLWKMISRVLREREQVEIAEAIATMERALEHLDAKAKSKDAATRTRAETARARVRQLLELARLGHRLLAALLSDGRVDLSPLLRVLLRDRD